MTQVGSGPGAGTNAPSPAPNAAPDAEADFTPAQQILSAQLTDQYAHTPGRPKTHEA